MDQIEMRNRLLVATGMWKEATGEPLPRMMPGDPADQIQQFEITLVNRLWESATPENAREIAATAQDLFNRVAKFIEHFEKIRAGLDRANNSFNDAVGSYERMVRPSGEKLLKLGGGVGGAKELANIEPLDATLRLPSV